MAETIIIRKIDKIDYLENCGIYPIGDNEQGAIYNKNHELYKALGSYQAMREFGHQMGSALGRVIHY